MSTKEPTRAERTILGLLTSILLTIGFLIAMVLSYRTGMWTK